MMENGGGIFDDSPSVFLMRKKKQFNFFGSVRKMGDWQ